MLLCASPTNNSADDNKPNQTKTRKASDLRTAVAEAARPLRVDLERVAASGYDDTRVIHGVFGPQCYINESYPSVLYLAYRHAGEFE